MVLVPNIAHIINQDSWPLLVLGLDEFHQNLVQQLSKLYLSITISQCYAIKDLYFEVLDLLSPTAHAL